MFLSGFSLKRVNNVYTKKIALNGSTTKVKKAKKNSKSKCFKDKRRRDNTTRNLGFYFWIINFAKKKINKKK